MSEVKLYAVKNDEGEYWDFKDLDGFWGLYDASRPITVSKENANAAAHNYGAHVVAFVEEPKKVALNKEQAEIVDDAHGNNIPASFMASKSDDEELMMNAYVNGYTVAKEKKYLLPMDGTLEENDDNDNFQLYAYCYKGRWLTDECETDPSYLHFTVTQKELETAPAWVKAINPVEVTDDEND